MPNNTRSHCKTLVIGSGIAGATAALVLAEHGLEVTLLSSGKALDSGNTALAQGGIVYKALKEDPESLIQDVFEAGRWHNNPAAVRHLAEHGPDAVDEILLQRLNIPFAHGQNCEWDLRVEGGHEQHRILHCADFTGRAIMDGLMDAVVKNRNIQVLTRHTAVDLLTTRHHSKLMEFKYQLENQCVGAYVFNEESGQVETILADYTILATGGLGQIYLHSTNSASCIGSGMTMAYRAGGWVMNAEFVQFHPTALFHRAERRFLISEAMRGAGAKLINSQGEAFMSRYDERADLAPRDVVARAILEEMHRTHEDFVYLDAANHLDVNPEEHFPTIFHKCMEIGIDLRREPIPVVPAAHYSCGGVLTDTRGRSTLDRLYAVGEVACTGVHGANRLASTSLLEGLLWGVSAARDIVNRDHSQIKTAMLDAIPDWENPGDGQPEDPALIAQDWSTIRNTMWNYVGITRTKPRLHRAYDDLRNLYKHLNEFYKTTPLSKNLVDLFHGSHAAYIVTMAALRNKKSLGCHYRTD